MNTYDPISCASHDYLEIACLYRYEILVEVTDGTQVTGIAETTETDAGKTEWLVLADERRISMDKIASVTALTPGAKFDTVHFTEDR